MNVLSLTVLSSLLIAAGSAAAETPPRPGSPPLQDWPQVPSAIAKDPVLEAKVARILAQMTLAQKIGQMTQPEIKWISPEQVRQFHIGSVLNGGGSWPGQNKHAPVADWLALAESYHQASMSTDAKPPIPVIWGTDAVHGNSNVRGATLFPHNIGLGAAHDPDLIRRIAQATARATRATGIGWVFAPTLAVAQDPRWGRTYESFSSDGALVREYAAAYTQGLQGAFADDDNVVATAKHYIGDGATEQGRDQGESVVSREEMINVHGQGYFGALGAGAQTVMASFNSWNDVGGGVNQGKMHGSHALLTEALKQKMGFDGFVVSDWNGIAQVPGCSNASCPQAINAGIDMVMVPEDWQAFIGNTTRQVQSGQIPITRIDDAVSRILRVKLRAGLFERKPSDGRYAGVDAALRDRDLARRAVRESLVMLKNQDGVLPLKRGQRVLVVGKSADSLANQAGGWSLTWQGTENVNADYLHADSVLTALRQVVGSDRLWFSETGLDVAGFDFDVVVAVIGETPYAETNGDIVASDTLAHSRRHPEDLRALQAAAATGKPVITVFFSGRPVYANDLINLSQAFVAAWLPGSEGKGITDVLFADAGGKPQDFRGRLSFPWPNQPCPAPFNRPDPARPPLFPLGYGLSYSAPATVASLPEPALASCGDAVVLPIFKAADVAPFTLQLAAGAEQRPLGGDLNATLRWPQASPALQVRTVQLNTQQDAKQVTWLAPARFFALNAARNNLTSLASAGGALQFDLQLLQAPTQATHLGMGCGNGCEAKVDLSSILATMAPGQKRSFTVPLACFAERGADLAGIDTPFAITADAPFAAAFANIRIVAGAVGDADALDCAGSKP